MRIIESVYLMVMVASAVVVRDNMNLTHYFENVRFYLSSMAFRPVVACSSMARSVKRERLKPRIELEKGSSYLTVVSKMYPYSDPHCTRFDRYNESTDLVFSMIDFSYQGFMDFPEFSPDVYQSLKTLNLSYNKITRFDTSIFKKFTKLTYLDLSHNYIHALSFPIESLPPRLKFGTNILDISFQHTPELDIDCAESDVLQGSFYDPSFIVQATSSATINLRCSKIAQRYLNIYVCTNNRPCYCKITERHKPVCHISPTVEEEDNVRWDKIVLCVVCFTGGFLLCGVCWYIVYYKKQRLQCVTFCTKYLDSETDSIDQYTYGDHLVYIVAAIEDKTTSEHFVKELEERCIQTIFEDRDFAHKGGQNRLSLIHGTIDKSLKTLFLLSENFIEDKECLYILNQAKGLELTQNRYVIIAITFKEHDESSIIMKKLLKQTLTNNVVLNYPLNLDEEKLFWDKLVECIRNDVHVHIVKGDRGI